MKLVSVSGILGSGKTTLIRELIARMHRAGKSSAVIVNEAGDAAYDDDFARRFDLVVNTLRGG